MKTQQDGNLNAKAVKVAHSIEALKNQHTPTPWFNWGTDHQGRRPTICDKAPGTGYSVGSEIGSINTDADAAFIVRAVNAHEELLGLLAEGVQRVKDISNANGIEDLKAWAQDAQEAIAKAEGK